MLIKRIFLLMVIMGVVLSKSIFSMEFTPICNADKEELYDNEITLVDYDSRCHKDAFFRIAFAEARNLMSIKPFTSEATIKEMIQQQVMPQENTFSKTKVAIDRNYEVIGFINYYIFHNENYGVIAHLAVDKEKRKKGTGRRLMQYALNDLQSKTINYVDVSVVGGINNSANEFYKQFGFESPYGIWENMMAPSPTGFHADWPARTLRLGKKPTFIQKSIKFFKKYFN